MANTIKEVLYKYQGINTKSLTNLDKGIFWASNPKVFNDPFECKYTAIGVNPKDNELDLLIDGIERVKLICLTEVSKNILMWSHYGDQHRGMCLGVEIGVIVLKVKYTNDFPTIKFGEKYIQGVKELELHNTLTTKDTDWSYEKERRMIFAETASSEIKYPGRLKEIIFGLRTPSDDISLVKSILKGQNVDFYKCKIVDNKFELDYDPI